MSTLRRNLRSSLHVAELVALATLLRSLVFEKWTTVVTALVLLVGARAALRGRTWGVGVLSAAATAFGGAVVLGFAPHWFWAVGLIGVLPFVLALRPMVRFDAGATALFAIVAGASGVAGAFAWREAAYALFRALH